MNRKRIWALAALLLAGLLVGCGEKALLKSGVLTKLDKYAISITASDGTVYQYAVDGETQLGCPVESLGDTLEVTSKGAYKDGVHADKIELVKKAEKAPTPVGAVYGMVEDAANASVVLAANDGKSYTIAKVDGTVVHSGHGIVVGDHVEVVYTGSLEEGTAVAQSILITSEGENKAAPTPKPAPAPTPSPSPTPAAVDPQPEPTAAPAQDAGNGSEDWIWYADGECVDDTMHSVLFAYEGVTYDVVKDDSTIVVGDIQVGDMIRVFHKGDLQSGMRATKIALVEKAQGAQPEDFDLKKVYGTIEDMTKSSLVLLTDDGKEVQVVKTDDTDVTVESLLGTYVEVSYRDRTENGFLIAVAIQ